MPERSVGASDRELRDVFGAVRGVAIRHAEQLREARRGDVVRIEEAGAILHDVAVFPRTNIREVFLDDLGAVARLRGTPFFLEPEAFEDHLGVEIIARFSELVEQGRDGPRGVHRDRVALHGVAAGFHFAAHGNTNLFQNRLERVAREEVRVVDALREPKDFFVLRDAAAELRGEVRALRFEDETDVLRRAAFDRFHRAVDLDEARRIEGHERGAALLRRPHDHRDRVFVDRDGADRCAKRGPFARLLIERGRDELVVEEALVDEDVAVDLLHTRRFQLAREVVEIFRREAGITGAAEDDRADGAAVDAAVERRLVAMARAERREGRRRGHQLRVRRGIQRFVFLMGREELAGRDVDDRDAHRPAHFVDFRREGLDGAAKGGRFPRDLSVDRRGAGRRRRGRATLRGPGGRREDDRKREEAPAKDLRCVRAASGRRHHALG